ncbi:hypothetical protein TSMEX_006919 [Taenia solium]
MKQLNGHLKKGVQLPKRLLLFSAANLETPNPEPYTFQGHEDLIEFDHLPFIPSEQHAYLQPDPIPPPLTSENRSEAPEEENLVRTRYSLRKPSPSKQQAEARKLAAELRKEKQSAMETRLRIRQEIAEERALRAQEANECEQQPGDKLATPAPMDTTQAAPVSDISSQIRIRVTMPSHWPSSSSPLIGRFDRATATQADLEDFVQSLLVGISTDEHEQLSLSLPCIYLSTLGTPRRQLKHESTRNSLLVDLGIVQNTRVVVSHDPAECPASHVSEPAAESIVESTSLSRPSSPELTLSPPQPSYADHIPPPPPPPPPPPSQNSSSGPNSQIPPRGSHPPGRSGSAAIWRALRPQPQLNLPIARLGNRRDIPSLCRLCLKSVVSLVEAATEGGDRFDIHFKLDQLTDRGAMTALHYLTAGVFPLPHNLGAEIVAKLCSNLTFNVASASLLKNFICDLDLRHYSMVSGELVIALVKNWLCLTGLDLGGQLSYITPYAIQEIGELKNLRVLRLDGSNGVDNNTINAIATLPNLEVLNVSQTNVTNNGWQQLESLHESGSQSVSPLRSLSVSDTYVHDVGLCAIVRLFPGLVKLEIDGTKVNGIAPIVSRVAPLAHLRYLNVNASSLLCIPPCLLPPITPSGSGLIRIDLRHCFDLRLEKFLGQLLGQPIAYLNGFFSHEKMSFYCLHFLAGLHLPLAEVDLTTINRHKKLSVLRLCRLLQDFSTTHLSSLFLPRGPISIVEEGSLDKLVECLTSMKNLTHLDFGDQAELLTPNQLFALVGCMPSLECVVARNLTAEQENWTQRGLPPRCRLRVQKHAVIDSGNGNNSNINHNNNVFPPPAPLIR